MLVQMCFQAQDSNNIIIRYLMRKDSTTRTRLVRGTKLRSSRRYWKGGRNSARNSTVTEHEGQPRTLRHFIDSFWLGLRNAGKDSEAQRTSSVIICGMSTAKCASVGN